MNAVEFGFALFAVFGSTALITGWTMFVYNLEKKQEEKDRARSVDILS